MPVFEYKCNDCGKVTEFLEKASSNQKHTCPDCQSKNMKKLLSGFAVGQSKSANTGCYNCTDEECSIGGCGEGMCPYSYGQ